MHLTLGSTMHTEHGDWYDAVRGSFHAPYADHDEQCGFVFAAMRGQVECFFDLSDLVSDTD